MYIPKHFKLEDEEMIYDFIEKYGFATLFSQHNASYEEKSTKIKVNFSDCADFKLNRLF